MFPRLSLLCVGIVMAMWSGVYPRPDGAPTSTCGTMTPGHGTAQTGNNPYNLTVPSGITTYKSGVPIQVTIGGTFKGVLLQARRADGSEDPVGTFDSPAADSNLKLLSCADVDGSAVTHASDIDKTVSVVTWNPPSENVGDIEFVATVAQERTTWWKNTKTAALTPDSTYPTETPSTGSQLKGSGGFVWFYILGVTLAAIYAIGL